MALPLLRSTGWFCSREVCSELSTQPSHIWMQCRRCSVTSSGMCPNRMALSINEVIMNRPAPLSLSALLTLAALLPLTATPSLAHDYRRYDDEGYYNGREYLYRPRRSAQRAAWNRTGADVNSCVEGSVIGGLLGAGLGAVLSRGQGRWIGVPVGGAAGALIGCQVDGG